MCPCPGSGLGPEVSPKQRPIECKHSVTMEAKTQISSNTHQGPPGTAEQPVDMEESPTVEDKGLDFIADCVLRTLKVKPDRWEKCMSNEDNRQVLQGFLDAAEQRTLVVSVNTAGLLEPANSFTASRKNKAVYFMKRNKAALSPESIKESLVFGDLSSAPLDQFSALVGEVSSRAEYGNDYMWLSVSRWISLIHFEAESVITKVYSYTDG